VYDEDEGETSSIIQIRKQDGERNPANSFLIEKADTVLYLKEINKYCKRFYPRLIVRYLALICVLPIKAMEDHGLLEYNVQCFKDAIQSIFGLQRR